METFLLVAGAVGVLVAVSMAGWSLVGLLQKRQQRADLLQARALFRRRREWLEAMFVTKASEQLKPRDLVWADCEFDDAVSFARDRDTGQLRALVGMTINFEAEEGGSMEDLGAVCSLRAATGVFAYENRTWTTSGKAIFNLNPEQTIRRYRHELEVIE